MILVLNEVNENNDHDYESVYESKIETNIETKITTEMSGIHKYHRHKRDTTLTDIDTGLHRHTKHTETLQRHYRYTTYKQRTCSTCDRYKILNRLHP